MRMYGPLMQKKKKEDDTAKKKLGLKGSAFDAAARPAQEEGRPIIAPLPAPKPEKSIQDLKAKARASKRNPIDLAEDGSLTGSVLIARPELTLTLDNNEENEIPSPMFFVADEINVDGEQALVLIMLNAPMAEEGSTLESLYPDMLDACKDKTIFYGGNFGITEDKPSKVQLLVEANDKWLSAFPRHPHHTKEGKKPNFMVIQDGMSEKSVTDIVAQHAPEGDFLSFHGYCLLPKETIGTLIEYSDFYVLEDPSAKMVFSDHAASKYLKAFEEFGLAPKQIPETVNWANAMRNNPKPH